jgi:CheY-like chemotaxis protein
MKQILVIDDEVDICMIAKTSLQITKNWQVFTAFSGEEGIATAHAKQPDAILLDVMMPGIDGLSTLRSLKANPLTQRIPVILLTAIAKATTRKEYLLAGAHAVFLKPFDPGTLADQIQCSLHWSA